MECNLCQNACTRTLGNTFSVRFSCSPDDDDDNDNNGVIISMLVQPRSRQLPWWVEELDCVGFGPLGEHRLLRDEAVPAVWGALVEHVLRTLVPAARLVVVVGNLSDTLSPKWKRKDKKRYHFTQFIKNQDIHLISLRSHFVIFIKFPAVFYWDVTVCILVPHHSVQDV